MRTFIESLPKAELHVHIEGTLEPELMFEIAGRNSIVLPYSSVEFVRQAYRFTNLQSFLDIYYASSAVLRTSRDFFDLAMAYFTRVASQSVRHAEIFFDPQLHVSRGVAFETILDGLDDARRTARTELGISSHLILCFLRHLSEEDAMATFDKALPHLDSIVAVGLDSAEDSHPPRKFERVFARARAEGLHAVAHAGEEGPPDYIREALDFLRVERIDHGVRCIEDPDLVARLVEEAIPLTVCPLSNIRLRVFEDMTHHPIKRLLDRGLKVTINSDDPAYFGGYINENYIAASNTFGLTKDELSVIAKNSFDAAFPV